MAEKKFYTFIGTGGFTFTSTISKVEFKQATNGKNIASASAAINNQNHSMNKLLKTSFPESKDEEETIWVNLTFWESQADRLQNYLRNRDKARLTMVGDIKARTYTKKDGTEGTSVEMNVYSWKAEYENNGGENKSSTAATPAKAPEAADVLESEGFCEVNDADAECPFF